MASEATLEDVTWLQVMVQMAFGKICYMRATGNQLVRIQLMAQWWKKTEPQD